MAFYRRCFFSAEIVVLNTFLSVMSTFLSAPITSTSSYRSTTSSDAVSRSLFNLSISEVSIFLLGLSHYVFAPVVTESHFFNLETRMRVSPIQSRSSRRDRDLSSSLSDFETRTRIPLIWSHFSRRDREFWKLPSFPEIRLERPHYFACNFWEANYIKCRAPHFARCSPILK